MKLDVWMEAVDRPVGTLERRTDASMRFTYAEGTPEAGRISMSLPVRRKPYEDADCAAFFGNLLFEGRELDRIKALHQIDGNDIAMLLSHLGADCPGAISVTREGKGPGKRPGVFPQDYEEIPADKLLEMVVSLHFKGHLPEKEVDPSPVAGVQPKVALVVRNGKYYRPKDGSMAPTTHILKVSPRNDSSLTKQEVALLQVAKSIGIDTASCDHLLFEDENTNSEISAILTERFDRSFDGKTIRRLHTEDFCQALGLPKELKYERSAVEGGPRFDADHVGLLSKLVRVPALFRTEFIKHTLFNLAVGNTDNHAKNGSLLYAGKRPVLAPLYDVVPVIMDDKVTHQFAFDIGSAKYAEDLKRSDMEAVMSALGFSKPKFEDRHAAIFQAVADSIGKLDELGGRNLADATAAQLLLIEEKLKLGLTIPPRDYFPRADRGVAEKAGGWGKLSS